jgi:hypothetical protein
MVQAGALMPDGVGVEAELFERGWKMIKYPASRRLDRNIRSAGWSFFFMAEKIAVTVYGFWGGQVSRRAVLQLLKQVKASGFNCLEITDISPKKFLGIPYVHVSAHPRHVQKGARLQSLAERTRTSVAAAWAIG